MFKDINDLTEIFNLPIDLKFREYNYMMSNYEEEENEGMQETPQVRESEEYSS